MLEIFAYDDTSCFKPCDVVILTSPTTSEVATSFGMLGDIIIVESMHASYLLVNQTKLICSIVLGVTRRRHHYTMSPRLFLSSTNKLQYLALKFSSKTQILLEI